MSGLLLFVLSAVAAPPDWESTLDHALPGIVAIRVTATRAFDTELPRSAVATGFVVDAERGLILTNRHVVGPGPVVAEAVFSDNEEVPLEPVYRDPVHDFGVFRYDPSDVHFMHPVALPLAPEGARVGIEIRVVGNDAGEKTSILAGTLARLDRDAPTYGAGNFNDYNTFYYQAASGTSGGSSGSPVLDVQGRVIALNAGARKDAASSFFLPLDRVVRALSLLEQGQPVPRGSVDAMFRHRPYDEVRRLGISSATEADFRARWPAETGMLTVEQIVPGGPAWGRLQPGDVLVAVDGQPMVSFVALDALLDDHVGAELRFEVERGGKRVEVSLPVADLHQTAPNTYLELSGATFNPLSLQIAMSYAIPTGSVMVATPGYGPSGAGLQRGAVILAINGQNTPNLDALEAVLATLPDGARVPVRYTTVGNPRLRAVTVLDVDRHWFPVQRCTREDQHGTWPCQPLPAPDAPAPLSAQPTAWPVAHGRVEKALARSLVGVTYGIPYQVDGVYGARFRGTGLVVDAERGLVVVDRDTVPVGLGDLRISFGGQVEVPGRVVWIHPVHNLAVIAYDPALVSGVAPRAATLRPSKGLSAGDRLYHVALDDQQRLVSRKTSLSRVDAFSVGLPSPPTFRDHDLDVLVPRDAAPSMGGVLADRHGKVEALWASFVDLSGKDRRGAFMGLPSEIMQDVLGPLEAGQTPAWRGLGLELTTVPLMRAHDLGLTEAQVQTLHDHQPDAPQALMVVRVAVDAPAASQIQEGDVLLSVNGQPVTRSREVELATRDAQVHLELVRAGQTLGLDVATQDLGSDAIQRALVWSGALLQEVPLAARTQRLAPPDGVYVAWSWFGSPAMRYGLQPTTRILAVDGTPTPTLDAFEAAVSGRANGSPLRLAVEDLDGEPDVITLKLDLDYWPANELRVENGAWTRRVLDAGPSAAR